MLGPGNLVACVALLAGLVDAQTKRITTTTTSTTASNTIYKCDCTAPPQSATGARKSPVTSGFVKGTTTYSCGCTFSKLAPPPKTTSTKTTRGTNSKATRTTTKAVTSTSSKTTTVATVTATSSWLTVLSSFVSTASESVPAVSTVTGSETAVPTAVINTNGTNSTTNTPIASGTTVDSTILIFARNDADASDAYSGLEGYGIPYEVVLCPQSGATLPTLNSSATKGNYGGIITVSELAYQNSAGAWVSGLSDAQFQQIYAYQKSFGVRMVRLDTYPWSAFGAKDISNGGCCDSGEQLISFSNTSGFPTANIKAGAGMSTVAIWHTPAQITDPTTTWEIAQYGPDASDQYGNSTAAVINNFSGRQQMVFFTGWATSWSTTSNFLQHGYIHWMTRGLFTGARKIYLGTQVDDVHLRSAMYSPVGEYYRSGPKDYQMHADWTLDINKRLPAGSDYFMELGHNGNGDIIAATNATNTDLCDPKTAIYYNPPAGTTLEYQKPLGSGLSVWPNTPTSYTWSIGCAATEDLAKWFMTPINRDAFAHVSHTFTHLLQNNATYDDIDKEIFFNQAWLAQVDITSGRFSPNGLIPPAITGLHNGDALRAWAHNNITRAVGDNSRHVLLNTDNKFWPLISTVANNGYDGITIVPRWPTKIYYDCDLPACTTAEWTDLFSGTGSFADLLDSERTTTTGYLLGLRHDPYMFHQANLRAADVDSTTVGSVSGQFSLLQIWVETVTQEMSRLTDWPIVSLKHDDIAQKFIDRMARDACSPTLSYSYSSDGKSISAVTVGTANGNTCSVPIAVTLPVAATSGGSAVSDKLGSEPEIKWVRLSGSAVQFTLAAPVAV